MHQSREDARDGATSELLARPLDAAKGSLHLQPGYHHPSPRPRSVLPKRDPSRGRHWICGDPKQITVDELLARNKAEYHITDVQARLDAAERAS